MFQHTRKSEGQLSEVGALLPLVPRIKLTLSGLATGFFTHSIVSSALKLFGFGFVCFDRKLSRSTPSTHIVPHNRL